MPILDGSVETAGATLRPPMKRALLLACVLLAFPSVDVSAQPVDPVKTLRIAFSIAETSFDPAFASDAASDSIIANVFEAMLDYDDLARPVRLRPIPCEPLT